MADELLLSSTPGGEWQHFKRGALRPSDGVYSGHREINSRHLLRCAAQLFEAGSHSGGSTTEERRRRGTRRRDGGLSGGLAGLGLDERRLRRQL